MDDKNTSCFLKNFISAILKHHLGSTLVATKFGARVVVFFCAQYIAAKINMFKF